MPVPSTKPPKTMRFPPQLWDALAARAAQEHRSVTQLVILILLGELPPITAQELAQHTERT